MDETPNDSGASANSPSDEAPAEQHIEPVELAPVAASTAVVHAPMSHKVGEIIRRPSVWGLLLLIAVVLVVQVWLLFL
ncbi:MAG: hypothetical protein QM758_27760 [Armatimonas sp.]